jgi:cell division protein FtsW
MRQIERRPDNVFLGLAAALTLLGLVALTSTSGPIAYQKFNDTYWYVKHQLLFGLLPGLMVYWLMSRIDYHFWRRHATSVFLIVLGVMLLVFIPGLGADWSTSKSWINIGGFSLQPAELAKLALVIYLAALFEDRGQEGVRQFASGMMPFLVAVGAVAILIILQPDLGSLIVIAAAATVVYFVAGAPWLNLGGLAAGGAVFFVLAAKAAPYRIDRLMTFLHPEFDPQGVGYQINQAFLAIGSGGLFGLGLGHSRQKYLYLPEAIGDSIFAVMSEELGYILMLAVLALIGWFLWRSLRIAKRAPDDFGKLTAAGIVGWLFFQTFFNIGSMIGLLPITGLPLPFVSYGGTAMIVLFGALGLLANISRFSPEEPSRRLH